MLVKKLRWVTGNSTPSPLSVTLHFPDSTECPLPAPTLPFPLFSLENAQSPPSKQKWSSVHTAPFPCDNSMLLTKICAYPFNWSQVCLSLTANLAPWLESGSEAPLDGPTWQTSYLCRNLWSPFLLPVSVSGGESSSWPSAPDRCLLNHGFDSDNSEYTHTLWGEVRVSDLLCVLEWKSLLAPCFE